MNLTRKQTSPRTMLLRVVALAVLAIVFVGGASWITSRASAQAVVTPDASGIRIGERLTYSVSSDRLPNIAYAEFYAVSRGRIGDKDAIEIRSKLKTLDLAS